MLLEVRAVRDIVKRRVFGTGASLLKNEWLGGLLCLFLTIDEASAGNDFWDQFEALEPAPMLLSF
jgi:hypothetical protein